MNQTNDINRRLADDRRREALSWLARRLSWERRLGQLRPGGTDVAETRQAA